MRDRHFVCQVLCQPVYLVLVPGEFTRFLEERGDGGSNALSSCVLQEIPPLFPARVAALGILFLVSTLCSLAQACVASMWALRGDC